MPLVEPVTTATLPFSILIWSFLLVRCCGSSPRCFRTYAARRDRHSGDKGSLVAPDRAPDRLLQIVVNDLAQSQRKVCADVNRGHDLEHRQIGHGSEGVRRQGERGGAGPRALQDELLEVIFDE